jgi:hypothetical protein
MKKLLLIGTALVLLLNSCNFVTGSGNIVTETKQVSNFTGINISSAFDAEVKIGPVTEVKIEADDNIIKYVRVEVSGNTLTIRTEHLNNISNAHLKVFITTPSLNDINASAAADVKVVDELKGNGKFHFNASSAATIEAVIEAPEVGVEASSSGTVKLTGRTKNYQAQASSGANIKTAGLLSETSDINVSSGANADVYASVSLNADASSGGNITYHGEGSIKQNTSSGGSVEKKN